MSSKEYFNKIHDEIISRLPSAKILNVRFDSKTEYEDYIKFSSLKPHEVEALRRRSNENYGFIDPQFQNTFFNLGEIKSDNYFIRNDEAPEKKNFDIVIGAFPLGMRDENIKGQEKCVTLTIDALQYIKNEGFGMFEFSPSYTLDKSRKILEDQIKKNGFYINGVMSIPKLLTPAHGVNTILFIVSRSKEERIFVAELKNSNDIPTLVLNFLNKDNCDNFINGAWIERDKFFPGGFQRLRSEEELNKLTSDYGGYKRLKIKDLGDVVAIQTGSKHESIKNNVFVPKIGNQPCEISIDELKIKHQNYIQLRLKKEIVSDKYVATFLNSPVGKFTLQSVRRGFIPTINKGELADLPIPVADKKIQIQISKTSDKLKDIKKIISEVEGNLLLKPMSATEDLEQINKIADILGQLTEPERIKALISGGESKTVEFKETFSLDLKTRTKENKLIVSSIKTIAAFLNSDGGDLLIGVADDQSINGLEDEISMFDKDQNDKFLLRFKNKIKSMLGENNYPLINQNLIKINNKLILKVHCSISEPEVFVDGNDYYVRTNPATDKLEGRELIAYIENRKKVFSNS